MLAGTVNVLIQNISIGELGMKISKMLKIMELGKVHGKEVLNDMDMKVHVK
jgi:hypothetical protein